MNQPRVTVITATYNLVKEKREAFFRRSVASVHSQTYADIEHLVIDGGSEDGTREILEEYAAKGWLQYISEPDRGIYDAMNKGIKRASGKYIAFLNSDDYWHRDDGVERSVQLLEATDADFSYAPYCMLRGSEEHAVYVQSDIASFFYRMPICHQTMFTKRELLIKLGGFDMENFKSAADYDLVVRAVMSGAKPVHVPLNFTAFRMGGISSNSNIASPELEKVYDKNFRFLAADSEPFYARHPEAFLEVLGSFVHPMVYARMLATVAADAYLQNVLGKAACHHLLDCSKLTLFPGIPVLKIEEDLAAGRRSMVLFGIPVLRSERISEINNGALRIVNRVKLLGIIPLWKTVRRETSLRVYLFGLLRIATCKTTTRGRISR
ncbi:MAG: glycosyltransferase family 2 protein [Akkermansia sp.]